MATAETISKAASSAQYGGPVLAVGSATKQYFGYSLDEWSLIGIVSGIFLGVAGYLTSQGIAFYFSWKQDRRNQKEHELRMILRADKHALMEQGEGEP